MRTFQRFFKGVISVTTCVIIGSTAQAQLSLGVKGGINFSNVVIKDSDEEGLDGRIAPNFGVVANYQLSPVFSIQAEPGFSALGAKNKEELLMQLPSGVPYRVVSEGTIKLRYFELPIVAQYRPHLTEKLEAIISAGPELRFRAAPHKLESTSTIYMNGETTESVTNSETLSEEDGIGKFDVGLVTGVGVAYPIGRFKVFAEGRYHLGLYNIASKADTDAKAFNRGASVVLGVTVPLLK